MTVDFIARYEVSVDTPSRLVLREKLWPRIALCALCAVVAAPALSAIGRDRSLEAGMEYVLFALFLVTMTFGLLQLLLVGSVEVIDHQKVVRYRAWGRKYRRLPQELAFSSLWYIHIQQVPRGRGWPPAYEVRLRRHGDSALLIDRSDGDHADAIALALQRHTGLAIDSALMP